jgi:hypothetical protein
LQRRGREVLPSGIKSRLLSSLGAKNGQARLSVMSKRTVRAFDLADLPHQPLHEWHVLGFRGEIEQAQANGQILRLEFGQLES